MAPSELVELRQRLAALKDLVAEGLIDERDFAEQKKALLAQFTNNMADGLSSRSSALSTTSSITSGDRYLTPISHTHTPPISNASGVRQQQTQDVESMSGDEPLLGSTSDYYGRLRHISGFSFIPASTSGGGRPPLHPNTTGGVPLLARRAATQPRLAAALQDDHIVVGAWCPRSTQLDVAHQARVLRSLATHAPRQQQQQVVDAVERAAADLLDRIEDLETSGVGHAAQPVAWEEAKSAFAGALSAAISALTSLGVDSANQTLSRCVTWRPVQVTRVFACLPLHWRVGPELVPYVELGGTRTRQPVDLAHAVVKGIVPGAQAAFLAIKEKWEMATAYAPITIPIGALPGKWLRAKVGSEVFVLRVPPGAKEGSQVILPLQLHDTLSPVMVPLVVPQGTEPGQQATVRGGNSQEMRFTVPLGAVEGDTVWVTASC